MSDIVSFAEIDAQCVELLPARTVLQVGGVNGLGFDGSGLNLKEASIIRVVGVSDASVEDSLRGAAGGTIG